MLWGEIWKIPNEIKKNGRNGQSQSGVDIYGVPYGKVQYSGIQCKGKDDYLNSRLKTKEIDEEIEKAKTFLPKLETFIIATSADKDVSTEEYIRIKDLDSRSTGGFRILLFDWEDIADLIETNKNTFEYYQLGNQFRNNFEFEFTFEDGSKSITVNPTYEKRTTKYELKKNEDQSQTDSTPSILNSMKFLNAMDIISPQKKSYSKAWIKIEIRFSNLGPKALDDYRILVMPEETKVRRMIGDASKSWMFQNLSVSGRQFYVFEDKKYGVYLDNDKNPMLQKGGGTLTFDMLVEHDVMEVKINYELRARDFNEEGFLLVNVEPQIVEVTRIEYVDNPCYCIEDIVSIHDYIVDY